MRIDFVRMLDVVVVDEIAFVYIFGSRPVTAQQETGTPDVLNMVAGDCILLPVQIHSSGAITVVGKAALLEGGILCAASANQSVIPVVLPAGVVLQSTDSARHALESLVGPHLDQGIKKR